VLDAAGGVLVTRAGLVALERGGDASAGASEIGGAADVCPLAASCDQALTSMRPRARSITLLIRILSAALVDRLTAWLVEPAPPQNISTRRVVKASTPSPPARGAACG
jgi:hypothetical protein